MKRPILNSAEASAEPAAATRPPAGLPRYVGEGGFEIEVLSE